MSKFVLVIVVVLSSAVSLGEALKCYHCYDSFNGTLSLKSLAYEEFGSKFIRCDKNKNNWNSWNCPVNWPICIVMSGTVNNHYEIVRTCAVKDFCSKYVAPDGVKLNYCQECNSTLCNDYVRPNPPEGPGPLFNFNININLNLKKLP